MIAEDFKADGGLIRSCKHEIKEYSCKKVIDKESKNAVKLSQILLCLEENIRDGREVSGQCVAEIKEIRREMMEDYSISPELVANCGQEIDEHCSDTKTQRQGQTIHCLMRLVLVLTPSGGQVREGAGLYSGHDGPALENGK